MPFYFAGTEASADIASASEGAWQEERMALESIFVEDATFPSNDSALISVDANGTRLTLDFRIRGAYPSQSPVIGVR